MKRAPSPKLSARDPRARRAIAKSKSALEEWAGERARVRAADAKPLAAAQRALRAAFEAQLRESPAAIKGLRDLQRHRFAGIDRDLVKVVREPPAQSFLSLPLKQHISIAIPPYDFVWTRGNGQMSFSNLTTGAIGIDGESGATANGSSDRVDAASGIGLILTTDKQAIVNVRPLIPYTWAYLVGAGGLFSSAEARGGIDAAAFRDGNIIDGVRRSELFSDSRGWAGSDRNDGGGTTYVPEVELSFGMSPGDVVVVNFGAWVECDHDSGIGSAAAAAIVRGTVTLVVVERFIGG